VKRIIESACPCGVLLFFLLAMQSLAFAQAVDHRPDPRQLFEKMRLATSLSSYQGSITYEHDGQLSSFSIANSTANGHLTQNIAALSGPERSFARQIDPCEVGGVEALKAHIAAETDELAQHYNFQARGEFRIAGRLAQEIVVMPVDQYRYGYDFAVDPVTGLMLHSVTLASDRKILERFQFVEIRESQDTQVYDDVAASCPPKALAVDASEAPLPWRLAWLPDGFRQLASRTEEEKVELVYSDGMATFSIFIERLQQVRFPPANTSIGATSLMLNYYQVRGDTYGVTIVGEVPLITLQRIATELHYEESSDAG
jgi:sigma-E factor negative regulatory protein RseB